MRTKLLVFLVGMMLLGSVGARAAQVTLDNLRYSLSDDGSLTAELTICYELTSPALVIPDYVNYEGKEYKVVSIGESVFKDFSNLISVTFPSGLTSIGNSAFYHCEGLTSIILPEGLTSIGMSAFYHCGGLTSIILPEGLTSIEAFTFEDCSGLTSITLPESLTSIDWKAFRGCRSLSSVTFPSGLTSIGLSAFSDCSSLVSIRCTAYVPPRINVNTFDQSHYAKSLYIPVGSEAAYMAATGWGNFRYIIEDAGLSIAEHNQSNLINYTDGIITLSDGESPAQVDVYTSDGNRVATSWIASGGSCDINYLPSGLYIVNVKAGDKMMSRKIVK